MRICVYCSASEAIDDKYVELARALGEAIAKRGWSLVWGGGQISMMGAVSRACREAGGRTVGVIPKKLADIEFADRQANELHVVDDMRVRKALMDDFSDAFITLPGGAGTMEEFFEIWVGKSLGFSKKPLIILDPTDFYGPLSGFLTHLDYGPLSRFLTHLESEKFVKPHQIEALIWTKTIDEALDACIKSE
ncbi:MAG: TIGR00730 family Rossman fold protein [Actinobacteria bacterium]|nr:TIGR00730 family Rossman fold protein [Actinomycetota bacterium]